jgi:hypothetical protein
MNVPLLTLLRWHYVNGNIIYIVYMGISAYVPKGTKGHLLKNSLDGSVLSIE